MTCIHRINNQCELGNSLCTEINKAKGILCRDDAFKACSNSKCPHTYNYVVASLTISHLREIKCNDSSIHAQLFNLINQGPQCKLGGPGTELKRLLKYLNIYSEEGCNCDWNASQMDYWGSDKCREEINQIIGWMKESSDKRKWTWKWNEKVARILIELSCQLSDGASWADIVIRLPITMMGL